MKLEYDIDIDFGDRDQVLSVIEHIPAAMRKVTSVICYRAYPCGYA